MSVILPPPPRPESPPGRDAILKACRPLPAACADLPMTDLSLVWLRASALLYTLAFFHPVLVLLRRTRREFAPARPAFQTAAVLHFVAIVERSAALGQLAANNFFETASLCALILAVVYLFIDWRYRFDGLCIFFFPLVTVLAWIGAAGAPASAWEQQNLRGALLAAHILLVLVGISGLLVSATGAAFYLLQERRLKRRQAAAGWLGRLAPEKLPPLETLDHLITRAMNSGFVALTLAVAVASVWASMEYGSRWIAKPAILISLVTWFFYLLMVVLRTWAGWRGRRAAMLSLAVLAFAAASWAAHVGLRPLLEH